METENAGNRSESLRTGLNGLRQLAQKAYDEKRRKDCLALTAAILKIDPEHSAARQLLTLIQSDIDVALRQVDQLFHDPHWNQDMALHKNAVRLLLSVLEIDPQHASASALLLKISPASHASRGTGKRDTPKAWEIEKVSYPIELGETIHSGAPAPWVRRAYLLIPLLLVVVAVVILYW